MATSPASGGARIATDVAEDLRGDTAHADSNQRSEARVSVTADDEFKFRIELLRKQHIAVAGSGECFPGVANIVGPEPEAHQPAFGLVHHAGCFGNDPTVDGRRELLRLLA